MRSLHVLRALAEENDVRVLALSAEAPTADSCPFHLQRVPCRRPRRLATPLPWVRGLVAGLPPPVARLRHPEMVAAVREELRRRRPDVLLIDKLHMAQYTDGAGDAALVLVAHNAEYLIFERYAEVHRGSLRGLLAGRLAADMRRYEARVLARVQLALATSELDRSRLLSLVPGCPVRVVPNVVDPASYEPNHSRPGDRLLYLGGMNWEPNVDAARHFTESILPLVRRRRPGAALSIVGRDPSPAVLRLAQLPGVEVAGTVPDVRPFLRDAAAMVVPLRIGSGTRLKIIEALAAGLPVVSTSIGCEGLPGLVDGRNILIADAPEAFAEAVLRVLADAHLRRQLSVHGRETAVRLCDLESWGHELRECVRLVTALRNGG